MNTEIKISKNISLVDEAFDEKLTGNYRINIQLSSNNISFAIADSVQSKILVLESYTFHLAFSTDLYLQALKKLFAENKFLSNFYRSVHVAIVNQLSTLVPDALFEEQKKEKYFSLNHSIKNDERLLVDKLKSIDSRNVFALKSEVEAFIKSKFPNAFFAHHSSVLIENILLQNNNKTAKTVFVHVQQLQFDVIVTEGKNLLFQNSFIHQTTEDFIYYILFVFEQLKLNADKTEIYLLGEIEKNSALYSIVTKYIRNVNFAERTDALNYSYKMNEIPNHFYYSVFGQFIMN